MALTLQKLDGRHELNTIFTHRVKYTTTEIESYIQAKLWLTEYYGLGLEREVMWAIKYAPEFKPEWAYYNDGRVLYIYLKDALVTHFSLKYLNT
jgi:hypothetical protein